MTPKDYFYHPTLCPIPWHGVYIEPDGKVMTCAVATRPIGNLKQQSLHEILTVGRNRTIRIKQLAQEEPENCSFCYQMDALSPDLTASQSNRSWYKKMCADTATNGIYDSADNFKLEILDLRWRNTCNLACAYCSPYLSSRWAQEVKQSPEPPEDETIQQTKNWIYQQLDTVRHVYLAGGEPLLIKENLDILERLKKSNPNVDLRVNTNLINIDTPVFHTLREFSRVKWTVSVENTEEQFFYTRYPGDWSKFMINFKTLTKMTDQVNINMTWSVMGSLSIFDCIEYFLAQGLSENAFIVNMVTIPDFLDVRNLSDDILNKIRARIKSMLGLADPHFWLYKSLSSMQNFIDTPIDRKPSSTLDYFDQLDRRRSLNFAQTFPDEYNDLQRQINSGPRSADALA